MRQLASQHDGTPDALDRVRGEIDQVKSVMATNIEKVLSRGEKIDQLVDKTETLNDRAFHFKKESVKLRNAMWWKKCKANTAVALAILGVIAFVVLYLCGIDFKKCKA
eukprot:c19015_g1_i2.p1 GENE.c19015_g1_i2~~c19015_g1_i2.p1  ORF type:complete len:108 (+),score=32.61 c19015_g1_i2:428-751(+)